MSQCTCKCNTSEEVPHTETVQEEAKVVQPHNKRMARGIHAFNGQEKEEVIKLIQRADKQEKQRLRTFGCPVVEPGTKAKLLYEDERYVSWGMPVLVRDEKIKMPPVGFGNDEDLHMEHDEEGDDSFAFMWQKLAGIEKGSTEEFMTVKVVKEKVVSVLGQKYNRMRFDWSNDPDTYLDQFLLINDAKTKISASPLVEIFQAVSKISSEDEAMATTCQVVVSKVSSLFE